MEGMVAFKNGLNDGVRMRPKWVGLKVDSRALIQVFVARKLSQFRGKRLGASPVDLCLCEYTFEKVLKLELADHVPFGPLSRAIAQLEEMTILQRTATFLVAKAIA